MTFQQYIQKKNLDISIFDSDLIGRGTRIDSDFYSTQYLKLISNIKSKKYDTVRNLCSNKTNRFKSEEGVFFDYLEIANINLIDGNYFYTSTLGDNAVSRAQKLLKNNDVVISTVRPNRNAVVLISDNDFLSKKVGSSGFCVLRKFKDLLPEYVFITFKTNIFIDLLVRYTSASLYPAVSEDDILDLPFPIPSNSFQTQIANLVQESYKQKELSKKLYLEAEKLLLSELGLDDYIPTEENISIKNSEEVELFGRVDAEFFQPKYDEIIEKIKDYKLTELGKIVDFKKGIEPGSEAYDDFGIPFIRVSDVSINGINKFEKYISTDLFDSLNGKYQPEKGDILFTKDGTIGITFVFNDDFESILSSAFLIFKTKIDINKNYLALVLNSIVCKLQIERFSGGALIEHLKPSDVKTLKIPILSKDIQEKIGDLILESKKARVLSKQLLEKAKKSVEIFIEEDEEKAVDFLDN